MNQENADRLKKYGFFISILVACLLFAHIMYIYLYHDAESTPVEWWSVSEWVIWPMSHLNPLIYSNDYNEHIINFLYRSLLKYDEKDKKIVWDLANCDIKNLQYIECYFKENVFWSNGKPVTANDVIATYTIIKNANLNPKINSLLEKTVIEEKAGNIIFRNTIKDVNFLSVLLQPIVSKETLDNIGNKELTWEFNARNGIYSGPYKVENLSYDDSLGIQKLILVKNEFYTDAPVLVYRYIYKFFKDKAHLSKHKEIINIFYDEEKIIGDTVPRLGKHNFFLNKYVTLFLNEEKIKTIDLREFILSKVNRNDIVKMLPSGNLAVSNLYLLDEDIAAPEQKNNNIESIMSKLWYFSKDTLKEDFVKELNVLKNKSQNIIENPTLTYITEPFQTKYNFLWEDNILITGNTQWKNVDEIFINGYKLSWYNKGDENFYYRLRTDFDNIRAGKNEYRIEFKSGNQTDFVEDFVITFSSVPEKLLDLEKSFFEWDKEKDEQRQSELETEIAKIDALEDKFYYNKNYEKFVLNIRYLDNKEDFSVTANIIKNILSTYGIGIEMMGISTSELNNEMIHNTESYDMLLVGLDLWYFNFNIFPYFHSSQASGGYNFTNTKTLNLDLALEELKSNVLSPERTKELQVKVLSLIQERFVAKTLYTKEVTYLVDRNIKDFEMKRHNYSPLATNQSMNYAYITSEKHIDFQTKWLGNFFSFLKNIFFNDV